MSSGVREVSHGMPRDLPHVPVRLFESALRTTEDAEIVLTVPCENECTFCSAKNFSREPPSEQIRFELLKAREVGVRRVNFTGGEPTSRRDFLELVAYARRLGFRRLYLKTHGRNLKDMAFARRVAEAGVNTIQISLHGSCAEVHDPIVGVEGAFEETMAGLTNALQLEGVKVNTLSVTVRQNVPDLPAIARLVASRGVKCHFFAHVYPVGGAWERFDEVVPTYREAAPYYRQAFAVFEEAGILGTVDNYPPCCIPGHEPWINLLYYKDLPNSIYNRKGEQCRRCIYDPVCEGITRQYAEKRGFGELVPVTRRLSSPRPAASYHLAEEAVARLTGVLQVKPFGGTLFRSPRLVMLTPRGFRLLEPLRRERPLRELDLAPEELRFLLSVWERGLARITPEPLPSPADSRPEPPYAEGLEIFPYRLPPPYPMVTSLPVAPAS